MNKKIVRDAQIFWAPSLQVLVRYPALGPGGQYVWHRAWGA